MAQQKSFSLACPTPQSSGDRIVLGHGGGGRLTQQLIDRIFLPAFRNEALDARHDGAVVDLAGRRLAISTDSYVVHPLIFPGGDIGDLAVNGTVNDLAMCGARPLWLTCGFILEEGLPLAVLERIVASMRAAAATAGVTLVAGDTKVVDRGKADGIFITTAGVGVVEAADFVGPAAIQPGDAIVLNGDVGAHGTAILSVREGLEFESPIESDTAALWMPVKALLDAGLDVHCLRDLTRGGLSTALNELASTRALGIRVEEAAIQVTEPVRGACELLGLDPLYVANEGRFIALLPERDADRAVSLLGRGAARIGTVVDAHPGTVVLRSLVGGNRVLDMLSGEQLPRIC
jgi:hydrogenase expression/formation protein HypE